MDFLDAEINVNPDSLSPLVWAYIGDAIYDLYIRTELVAGGFTKVKRLHCEAIKYVKASAQADFMREITEELTPEELTIMKRGRNTKSTVPRKTEVSDYRYSTGLESLLGYLYLQGNKERVQEILNMVKIKKNI